MIVLKDNLVRMSNNNVVIGMGIKGRAKMAKSSVPIEQKMAYLTLGSGVVSNQTSVKRKPINFL